jgi:hypothetical protein
MSLSGVRNALKFRRLASVATLVFVIFLPLHFHISPTTPVAKECSCLHGTRTQLALAVHFSHSAAPVEFNIVASQCESLATQLWFDSQKVRGPPTLTSL